MLRTATENEIRQGKLVTKLTTENAIRNYVLKQICNMLLF